MNGHPQHPGFYDIGLSAWTENKHNPCFGTFARTRWVTRALPAHTFLAAVRADEHARHPPRP
jgi:hypothetical protein